MPTELTNEQVFKLICMEVIESMGISFMGPVQILHEMTNPRFIDWCEHMIFIDDDRKLDEGEKFLLDWMKQNAGKWEIIEELFPVADRIEMKLRY